MDSRERQVAPRQLCTAMEENINNSPPDECLQKEAATIEGLLHLLANRRAVDSLKQVEEEAIKREIPPERQAEYLHSIRNLRIQRDLCALSPSLFFDAADQALDSYASSTSARIGILPGTMNPPHLGHVTAAIAAVIDLKLNAVFLAPAGIVPEKPDSPSGHLRLKMVEAAVDDKSVSGWLHSTSVRLDAVEMFLNEPQPREFGLDDSGAHRRLLMDVAAFAWLFRANPNVNWTYLVGSDKVADYGRGGQRALIVDTLCDSRARTNIVYYPRRAKTVDFKRDVEPYPWLSERWRTGHFKESPIKSLDISGHQIRAALGSRRGDSSHAKTSLQEGVLHFIMQHEELLALYSREARAEAHAQ
jgi:hypothetical protein